jgi:hypothetical protein
MRSANEEALRAVAAAQGSWRFDQENESDCAKRTALPQAGASLYERFGKAGFALHPLDHGKFVVSRWGLWRVHATNVSRAFASVTFPGTDMTALHHTVQARVAAVKANDLGGADEMLTCQAVTLDAVANECFRRAALNMGEYPDAMERYMRLGLKAQAQARATWETIATIKNPPVVYAKQANFAAGHQQVNNSPTYAQAETQESRQNEVLDGNG